MEFTQEEKQVLRAALHHYVAQLRSTLVEAADNADWGAVERIAASRRAAENAARKLV